MKIVSPTGYQEYFIQELECALRGVLQMSAQARLSEKRTLVVLMQKVSGFDILHLQGK